MKKFFVFLILGAALLLNGAGIENLKTNYQSHLQGMTADETGVYWCFTTILVKTDFKGKVLKELRLPGKCHFGDLCTADGDIYSGVLLRDPQMIRANNGSASAVWLFSSDLKLKKQYPLSGKLGVDGITFYKGKFYVAPNTGGAVHHKVVIDVYDREFKHLKQGGFTAVDFQLKYGAQNLSVVNGKLMAGYYGGKGYSFLIDLETLQRTGTLPLNASVGLAKLPPKIAGNDITYLQGLLRGKNGTWKCAAREVRITPAFKVNYP